MASSAIRPAGRSVEFFNEERFSLLRRSADVPDDFVNEGWSFESLAGGGGKGGTLMAKVGDYVVKELSKGDHHTLLEVSGSLCEHILSGPSLLCPIYLHFRDVATNRMFFVMQNAIGSGPFQVLYDLKGCADDKLLEKEGVKVPAVHKRVWNLPMWCSCTWSQARRRYYAGKCEARQVKIPLLPSQRDAFLEALRRDVSWLGGHQLMDYSLLVGIQESTGPGFSPRVGRPYVQPGRGGQTTAVYISIIDFLQKWTMGKRVARVLKVLEQNKATIPPKSYAARFAVHFTQSVMLVENPEDVELPPMTEKLPHFTPPPKAEEEEDLFNPVPVEPLEISGVVPKVPAVVGATEAEESLLDISKQEELGQFFSEDNGVVEHTALEGNAAARHCCSSWMLRQASCV